VLPHVDDVELCHLVARDVHLTPVDQEVSVADELPCLPTRASDPRAVDDIVQPPLENLQENLAGLTLAPICRLVVALELPFQHAVRVPRLLLLLQLQEVLGLLDPAPAVLAGREGTPFECLVSADKVRLQTAGLTCGRAGVTSHGFLLLPDFLRPCAASAACSRCAVAG